MVWVGGGRSWRGDHLLVGELEPLLDDLDISRSVLETGDGLVSEMRSGGRAGSRPIATIEAEK